MPLASVIRKETLMQAEPTSTPKPQNATQKVADALALAIHEHRLMPGTKLGEDEIGEIYNVSRTVVRAALQSLAHVQLVEIQRNKGAFVASPTTREAREVFEARILLEPRTARSAASRATPRDIEILNDHIAQEHLALDAGDNGRALNLSGRFISRSRGLQIRTQSVSLSKLWSPVLLWS